MRAKVLDNRGSEFGHFALLCQQHYGRRVAFSFFDQALVVLRGLITWPQIVPASRVSPFARK